MRATKPVAEEKTRVEKKLNKPDVRRKCCQKRGEITELKLKLLQESNPGPQRLWSHIQPLRRHRCPIKLHVENLAHFKLIIT